MSASKADQVPPGWDDVIRESDADLAQGRVVELSTIRAELRETVEAIEAELAAMGRPDAI